MDALPSDADLHARQRRKRRWLVGILLALMLVLGSVAIGLAWPASSLSIEEAKAILERLFQDRKDLETTLWFFDTKRSKDELITLLGKPTSVSRKEELTMTSWKFYRQALDSVDGCEMILITNTDNSYSYLATANGTYKGWDAWKFRWTLLQSKFGLK